MASKEFYFPTTVGKHKKLKAIPDVFPFGIFNIKVVSNDINFNKVFAYSKHHHYTHHS